MNEANANPEPEKLDLSSLDVAELKQRELLELFPEVRTEGGKIDFDRLKAALGEMVDAGRERYGMNWPGKAECMRTIQAPSMGTLLPMPDESVEWDTTENVIIEGDNLEVLKLLQKSYLGKVKVIYLDPPYNTGKEFIYPDNYQESLQTYLEYSGQIDNEGRRFGTNTESDGRIHSKWLNMMFSRLYLARHLLTSDGIVFISIDDHELNNLIALGKEVFGDENFVGVITRSTGTPTGGGNNILVNMADYIVVFARSSDAGLRGLEMSESDSKIYDQEDEHGKYLTRSLRRTGGEDRREDRPSMFYGIPGPDGIEVFPYGPTGYESRWICGKAKFEQLEKENLIEWKSTVENGTTKWKPYQKFYLEGRKKAASNLWTDIEGNKKASRDLRALLGDKIFEFPKPVELISKCISIASDEDSIVLDFFAGSGTTAEAVARVNKQDNGRRKFILVQLPEPTEFKDYPTIAHVTRERVRRAFSQMQSGDNLSLIGGKPDYGFRSFSLAPSNFIPWDGTASNDAHQLAQQLKLSITHTREDRTASDLLYEVLLKSWGEPALSLKVGEETIEGVRVFSIADGAFLICLEEKVTLEFIRALAARKPDRVVMRESAFAGNDQLKTNAVQTFKSQGVTSFKVV